MFFLVFVVTKIVYDKHEFVASQQWRVYIYISRLGRKWKTLKFIQIFRFLFRRKRLTDINANVRAQKSEDCLTRASDESVGIIQTVIGNRRFFVDVFGSSKSNA